MNTQIINKIKEKGYMPEEMGYFLPKILDGIDIKKVLPEAIGARSFNQAIKESEK